MFEQTHVNRPKTRSALRKRLGKEWYILNRYWQWMVVRNFAKTDRDRSFIHSLIQHQSLLLRPLKDVDMYLQHNKVTNLKIAIGHIDGAVIRPGQTFSIWKMIGRPTASKGYLEGLSLNQGTVSKDIGGGLCQLGNLLF